MRTKKIKILGLDFINEPVSKVYSILNTEGGFMTVPSGPGIASIPDSREYYNALKYSDIILADSGLMALVWNLISKEKIIRTSGLGFINYFLEAYIITNHTKSLFLVNPALDEQDANLKYLNSNGFNISSNDCYLAPIYDKLNIKDEKLLEILNEQKPHWILLNIGGGIQEILGYWLRKNLSYKPAIICTGAAIAFKTGKQVQIPSFIDKIYMGWLWRVISNPKVYGKRFWEARTAATLVLKYKEKAIF